MYKYVRTYVRVDCGTAEVSTYLRLVVLGALINRPSRLVCEMVVVVLVAICSGVQNPSIPALRHLLRTPTTNQWEVCRGVLLLPFNSSPERLTHIHGGHLETVKRFSGHYVRFRAFPPLSRSRKGTFERKIGRMGRPVLKPSKRRRGGWGLHHTVHVSPGGAHHVSPPSGLASCSLAGAWRFGEGANMRCTRVHAAFIAVGLLNLTSTSKGFFVQTGSSTLLLRHPMRAANSATVCSEYHGRATLTMGAAGKKRKKVSRTH